MNLYQCVLGDSPQPDEESDAYEDWSANSDKAIDYLIESCEEEPQDRIQTYVSAIEAWKILKNTYEGQTRSHLMEVYKNLINIKFDDRKTTMVEHIKLFETVWYRLAQLATNGRSRTTNNTNPTLADTIYPFTIHDG
jgi:hypothetical protein